MWDSNKLAESMHFKIFGEEITPDTKVDPMSGMAGWQPQEFYEKLMEIFGDSEFWQFQEKDRQGNNQEDLSPVVYECLKATSEFAECVEIGGWYFDYGSHAFIGRWCYIADAGTLMSGCNGGQLMVQGSAYTPAELSNGMSALEVTKANVEQYFGALFEFQV